MSEIIKIPLGDGFNKQSDAKLVGSSLTVVTNFHNLDKGVFVGRKGYGVPITLTNRLILDFGWWIEPVSKTLYWFGYDYDSSKQIIRLDSSFANEAILDTITNAPSRIRIQNYGNAVRFVRGINHNTSVYQKINRNFFNNGISYIWFKLSSHIDDNETITLTDYSNITKTYKAVSGGGTADFTGAVEGGSSGSLTLGSTSLDGFALLIKGLKADGSTLDITYYFESDGTKTTGQTDGTYTYVDISGSNGANTQAILNEFLLALKSENGHNNLISGNIIDPTIYMRQTIAGSGGDITITVVSGTNGTPTGFQGGSSSTNVLVRNESDSSGTDNTISQMTEELKTAINGYTGHNGGLVAYSNVDNLNNLTEDGGIYIKQGVYNSITPKSLSVSGGFNDDCETNPPATFSTGIGYTYNDFKYAEIYYPRLGEYQLGEPTSTTGGTLPFTTSSRNVHYKIAPVFDGVQEGLMSNSTVGPIAFSGTQNNSVQFTVTLDQTTHNPRMTGLNIYRAITTGEYPEDGFYKLVKQYNLTSGVDSQWVTSRLGYKGRSLFSAWDTDDFSIDYAPNTYYNISGLFSADTSIGANKVSEEEGDLFKEAVSATNNLGTSEFIWGTGANYTASNWSATGSNNTVFETTRHIKDVKKRFVRLDDDTLSDHFGEPQGWVICSDNLCFSANSALVARGVGQWGDFNGGSGLTVHTGSVANGQYTNSATTFSSPPVEYDFFETTNPITGFQGGSLFFYSADVYLDCVDIFDNYLFVLEYIDYTTGVAGATHNIRTIGYTGTLTNGPIRGVFKIPANCTAFKLKCRGGQDTSTIGSNGSILNIQVKEMVLSQIKRAGTKAWTHQSLWAVDGANVATDSAVGRRAVVDGISFFVSNNIDDVFRNAGNSGFVNLSEEDTQNVIVNGSDSSWTSNGSLHTLSVLDAGLGETTASPLAGVNSIDTRFLVSDTVNGRTFGCNVKLFDKTGESNAYDDMIIYSELQQPDVMPISNYIKLNDLQGGAIVGVAGIMSDLVVFAERGIFRLSIPSSDPTGWSLVESEPNLGCNQPFSIKKWKNGVFFAGTDNIYYITPNFEFISVSENWRDVYQSKIVGTTDENQTVIEIDNNNERLLVKYGTEFDSINVMDLSAFEQKKLIWYKYDSSVTQQEGDIDSIIVKNDSKVYIVNKADDTGNDTKIRELVPSSVQGTQIKSEITTGYISLASMTDKNSLFIRRVNIQFESGSGTLFAKIYINHQNGEISNGEVITKTIITDADTNVYSVRVGKRVKGFQLNIYTQRGGTEEVKLRDVEIEVD